MKSLIKIIYILASACVAIDLVILICSCASNTKKEYLETSSTASSSAVIETEIPVSTTATPEVTEIAPTPTIEVTTTAESLTTPEPTSSEVPELIKDAKIPIQGTLMYTWYDECSKWGRQGANPKVSGRGGLVSIDEQTLFDDELKIYLHSCAIDSRIIPWGTIFYIEELDRYFIADDNTSTKMLNYLQSRATDLGAEIWMDLFICTEDQKDATLNSLLTQGTGILHYQIIRWGY